MNVDGGRGDGLGTLLAGRYRLHHFVGHGGMGTVWNATDELLGRDVAVKRVRLNSESPAEATLARERTMREAQIAAKLHHPHIVTIFDVITMDDEPWLILEYLPSRSLGSILAERGTLPPAVVATIGAQVAAALAAAHAAGIVHRDVKPDNILIAEAAGGGDPLSRHPPIVKLTDFGVSHAATAPALTRTGVLTGTPAYFAPETARGEGTDPRSDVFSLGATLYAAVEGQPPFGRALDDNLLALLARIARGDTPPPYRAGPLAGVIRYLTADDPGDRPTAAQAQHILEQLATTPPTIHAGQAHTRPPTIALPPETAPPSPRRPRRPIIVAAVALLAAAAVAVPVAIALTRDSGEPAGSTPPSSTPPSVGAISVGDPQTADPCSLVDLQAMNQHGQAEIDRDDSHFSECRVYIAQPDRNQHAFSVDFRSADDPLLSDRPQQQLGQLVLASEADLNDNRCTRQLTLPDRTIVVLEAESVADGNTAGLCAIADTGTTAAVRALETGGVGRRPAEREDSVLTRTDACFLLGPGDVATVPGMEDATLTRGFAGWGCEWNSTDNTISVRVDYRHSFPLTSDDGVATDFGNRPGASREFPLLNACVATFTQRFYTAPDGSTRIDEVVVGVHGGVPPGTDRCQAAVTLAHAAAGRLPAPG